MNNSKRRFLESIGVLARIAVVIFCVEALIMVGFDILKLHDARQAILSIIDATLLVVISGPILFFWVLRPYIRARDLAASGLEEREETFRAIAETANDGIITIDDHGAVVFWNKQAETIFGFSADDMMGGTLAKIMPPAMRDIHIAALERLRAGGEPRHIGRRLDRTGVHKDGHELSLELTVSIQEVGGSMYFTGIVRDVSERRHAEEALRESEERYRGVATNLPGLVYQRVREPDGRIRYAYMSPGVRDIYGIEPEEVLGDAQAFLDRVHPEDRDRYRASLRESAKSLEPWDEEFRAVTPDGEERWVRGRSRPRRLEGGAVVWDSVLLDITERKRAEEALRESEEQLRALIENSQDVITVVSADGTVRFASPSVEWVLGYPPEELLGADGFDFVDPEDAPNLKAKLAGLVAVPGAVETAEFRFRHKDGSWRRLDAVGTGAVGVPGVDGIVLNARDVSEARALEEQLRQAMKMEAVGQLTGGIAHDFNNLLTVILGNLQLLERRLGDDERLKRRVTTAAEAAQRGAQLTKRLLAFARRQVLEPKLVDVNELVASTETLLRRTLGETVELRTKLGDDPWPAFVDPVQLESAVLNLAVNARDAMPDGGTLTIETANVTLDEDYAASHPYVTPGPHTVVAVSDSGTGMAAEVVARCFEPFFTTKAKGVGTGLGLSMVYGFVKQSGGHVQVYSEKGHGTTVKLYLPRAEADAAEPYDNAAEPGEVATGSEAILLVEDDAAVRQTIAALLEELGYYVLEAEEGAQALSLLGEGERIDLLLTDMVLPGGMNGSVLAGKARERRPGLKVIYMSGYTEDAVLQKGLADDKAEFIAKPPQRMELATKIRSVLDG